MIERDENITFMDTVSTKQTNSIATNVTSTASIYCHSKKVRDCYILYTVLLAIIQLLTITIICYHYTKKRHNTKMENNEIKNLLIKNHTCYYFDDIIKLKDFDLDILIDKNSHRNILIYDNSYKTLIGSKLLQIKFDKINGIIRIYDGTRYITLFSIEKYDAIYDRTRYLISLKSSITYIFSHYFAKVKVDFYDSLPIEKKY